MIEAIRNFFSHQLSPNESEVLALCLNFVLTPSPSTHHLIQKLATRLTQTMKKQFHFKNHLLTIKRPKYCKPFNWMSPEPNSTNLSLFLEQIQGPLPNHSQHTKIPNLTSQQWFTLKKLGFNPELVIKPFDKGSGIYLKDTSLYINKIEEHLADATTYKKLNIDPTKAIRNDVLNNPGLPSQHPPNR